MELFKQPEGPQDYVEAGLYLLSKRALLFCAGVFAALLCITLVYVVPFLEGLLWTPTIVVNSQKFHTYTGRAYVVNEGGQLIFDGYIDKGQAFGQGVLYDGPDMVYAGAFENNKYNGLGKRYADGRLLYEGYFTENAYNGEGVLYYPDGTPQFEGVFKDGLYVEGKTYSTDGKLLYEGTFNAGIFDGEGTLFALETGKPAYTGGFVQGVYQGQGKRINPATGKALYEGEFLEGQYSGMGKEYADNGILIYEGYFAEGQYEGEGKQFNGATGKLQFEGSFSQGVYEGYGMLYHPSGTRPLYEGGFSEGLYDQEGTLYSQNGKVVFQGKFIQGDIDYVSLLAYDLEGVREAFGPESQLLMLENSFLLVYSRQQLGFEFTFAVDNAKPALNRIKFFGNQAVYDVAKGVSVAAIKESFPQEVFTAYPFGLLEEDALCFRLAGEKDAAQGQEGYSIKILLDDLYMRAFSWAEDGEVCYFEIGGV